MCATPGINVGVVDQINIVNDSSVEVSMKLSEEVRKVHQERCICQYRLGWAGG